MTISVIITGATGRMGSTLVRMVKECEDLVLAGVVEQHERLEQAGQYGCAVATDIATLLKQISRPVIIDFTAPEVSIANAKAAVEYGACHVIGTTGFSEEQKAELNELAKKTPIFWSPNMSVGVNALLKLLPDLTKTLGEDYDIEVMEIHHNRKKDSPSGTALRLGECVAEARDWSLGETACYHREGIIGERPKKEIGMQTLRGGDVVGVHTVYYFGAGERIEVTHQAHSRENFAQGALRAARWLFSKEPGTLYSMQDVL